MSFAANGKSRSVGVSFAVSDQYSTGTKATISSMWYYLIPDVSPFGSSLRRMSFNFAIASRHATPNPSRRDGHALLHIRPAETFGPHEVATHTHRHRQARQVLLGKTGTREPSALVYRGGPLW